MTFKFAKKISTMRAITTLSLLKIKGDGGLGYPEMSPYDRIYITAACTEVPSPLMEQLKTEGKLIAPIIEYGTQNLVLFESEKKGIRKKVIESYDFLLVFAKKPVICFLT